MLMTKINSITERIRDFLFDNFPLARSKNIRDDDRLLELGIIDSMGVLDLVAFLEGEFGISMTDEELTQENFQTISRLAALVQEKVSSLSQA
jgi:acyl carrier protein